MKLSIFIGDIADAPADALCTSTNPRLSLMMGTGASIRARGGPVILAECAGQGTLPAGSVHVTSAGTLPHKIVIHCVASDADHRSSPAIVATCVANALACADTAQCAIVAIPLLGTGHAHLPIVDATLAIASTALTSTTRVHELSFVVNDAERAEEVRKLLQKLSVARVQVERSPAFEEEPTSLWSDDNSLRW